MAALLLTVGLAGGLVIGCGFKSGLVDPDDQPFVTDDALRESRFFTIGVLRSAPVDHYVGDVGVRAVLPKGTDPFDALVAVVDEAGTNGVTWEMATCIVGDMIILRGSEHLDGHDNPVQLRAEGETNELTFAIDSATANNEPSSGDPSAIVDGCTPEEQAYLTDLIES
ncbi:hypothetical protein ACE2AJ_09380 [Aquihabitans daechungensis]|uniref:hypothetical protein n=1 Tax=Aquihabitans daechungensis TaxID=1052257 RepID=UPI003BA398AB